VWVGRAFGRHQSGQVRGAPCRDGPGRLARIGGVDAQARWLQITVKVVQAQQRDLHAPGPRAARGAAAGREAQHERGGGQRHQPAPQRARPADVLGHQDFRKKWLKRFMDKR